MTSRAALNYNGLFQKILIFIFVISNATCRSSQKTHLDQVKPNTSHLVTQAEDFTNLLIVDSLWLFRSYDATIFGQIAPL